ncbi:MAG TPA: hypothetical protein VK608_04555 [Edaphobacter sp.]|nr:hypothetical protein [Edaphobacter sp.]
MHENARLLYENARHSERSEEPPNFVQSADTLIARPRSPTLRLHPLEQPTGKNEFETTAHYEQRLKTEGSILHGGIPRDSTLAFVVPTDASQKSSLIPLFLVKYDADKELFTVSVMVMPVKDVQEEIEEHAHKSYEERLHASVHGPQNYDVEWMVRKLSSRDYVGSKRFWCHRKCP